MKSNEYFAKRFEILQDKLLNKGDLYEENLKKQYTLAASKVEKEIESWFARFARSEGISLREAKKLLSKDELEAFKLTVDEYIKLGETLNYSDQWAKTLERASVKVHITRLESLKIQMRQQVEALYAKESEDMYALMTDIYTEGYYRSAYEVQKGFQLGFTVKIDTNRVEKLLVSPWTADGLNFSERIWGKHRPELVSFLERELTQSIIRGENPQKLIDNVSKKFNVSKRQAGNLVMTESAFFASASNQDCLNGLNVKEYQNIATLDFKTSEICQSMDGTVFNMSEYEIGVTAPPFHPRCRTVASPYFNDEFTKDNTRIARGADGKTYYIPADITYKEWRERFT